MQSLTSLIDGLSLHHEFQITLITPSGTEISKYPFKGKVRILSTHVDEWGISRKNMWCLSKVAREIYEMVGKDVKDSLFVSNDVGASIVVSFMPCWKVNEVFVCRGGNFKSEGLGGIFIRNKIRFRRFKHIVVTASHLKDLVKSFNFPEKNISIIYNGLSLPDHEYPVKPPMGNLLRISTVGYISDLKNQIVGVETIKKLRENGYNAKLYIYGVAKSKSDQDYKNKLDQYIIDMGMQPYIEYKGFVKGENLFSSTDIMVSFSKTEGFGRTLVEFMLRHIPVVAYRGAGGPIDITQDGKFGVLVARNDGVSYTNAIINILNDSNIERNLELAFNYAMMNFSISQMVSNYVNLFCKLGATNSKKGLNY